VNAWKVCTGSSHKSGGTATTWNREPMSMAAALSLTIGKPVGFLRGLDMFTS
jgi:hypothetical protein